MNDENEITVISGLDPGIRSITTSNSVILFGGKGGFIQKICFYQNEFIRENIESIDNRYMVYKI